MPALYSQLTQLQASAKKWLAVLIDPEKIQSRDELLSLLGTCSYAHVNLLMVGGSVVRPEKLNEVLGWIKSNSAIPVLLFPGSAMQVNDKADGLLFLSLISGRNADLLIGQHVLSAPILEKSSLEVISCGYMLVDGGKSTSVSYISHTLPIPADKPEIAAYTAYAGELLGLKSMYLEAGSGANDAVPLGMIEATRKKTRLPLFVGGGINTREKLLGAWNAGADVVVIGTAIEKNNDWLIHEEVKEIIVKK